MLAKVKEWAGGSPRSTSATTRSNPVIRVQLSDVDYESVVENAQGRGQRRAAAAS